MGKMGEGEWEIQASSYGMNVMGMGGGSVGSGVSDTVMAM